MQFTPQVNHLYLRNVELDETTRDRVSQLSKLETIWVNDDHPKTNFVPDDFFAKLNCRESLKWISLRGPRMTLECLEPLVDFPNLEKLTLRGNKVPAPLLTTPQNQLQRLKQAVTK